MANSCGKAPTGNDREVKFCKEDVPCRPARNCEFGEWGVWSECSSSCDGVKSRSREIKAFGQGGGAFCLGALNETWPCNPDQGGLPPVGCKSLPPVDCELGDWKEWSTCTATCGGGQHVRGREIAQAPAHGGRSCEDSLSEVKECGRQACDSHPPVDCAFGDWQAWTPCDKCDGERKRFRSVAALPAHGGKPCESSDAAEVAMCPRTCDAQRQTCVWADWGSWSVCTAACGAGGYRRRHRLMHLGQASAAGLEMQKYEARLHEEAQTLEAQQLREAAAAFATGCLAVTALLATARSTRAWRARSPRSASSPLGSGNPYDTAEPLVESTEEVALGFDVAVE